jgi:hydrogenase-4 membrane subunit HyfE
MSHGKMCVIASFFIAYGKLFTVHFMLRFRALQSGAISELKFAEGVSDFKRIGIAPTANFLPCFSRSVSELCSLAQ